MNVSTLITITYCVLCDEILNKPPSKDPWIRLKYNSGIHHRCIEHLNEMLVKLKTAPELGDADYGGHA